MHQTSLPKFIETGVACLSLFIAARFYLSELVSAVEFVHAIGFLHRDIKTSNVVIDRRGHLRLIDFGFAKQVGGGSAVCQTAEQTKPCASI